MQAQFIRVRMRITRRSTNITALVPLYNIVLHADIDLPHVVVNKTVWQRVRATRLRVIDYTSPKQ